MPIERSHGPLLLPGPLQRRLETTASAYFAAPPGRGIDFSNPPGEAALTAPDSLSWRIFKNPLVLFAGGVAAVILEFAEPRVRTGVWNTTSFRADPAARLRSTGLAAMMTVYGPRSRTEAMIAAIRRRHGAISGVTEGGQAFHANDPALLDWVYATASFGFLEAFHAYVSPLDAAERDRFYAEGRGAARLYGAVGAPASQRELDALMRRMDGCLEGSPVIFEFLGIMRRAPLLPGPLAHAQHLFVKAAVELVPGWLRERLGLDARWNLQPWQRMLVRRCGAGAERLMLRSCPPVLACRRMGLADDYLYRQPGPARH